MVYVHQHAEKQGPQMEYWLECKGMAEVDLRFVEKKNPGESVSDLAQNMQVCDPERCCFGKLVGKLRS